MTASRNPLSRISAAVLAVVIVTPRPVLGAEPRDADAARLAASNQQTAVGVWNCTFIDTSRSVFDYSSSPPRVRAQRRTLLTEIRYPSAIASPGGTELLGAPAARRRGGYPVVVFAHGYDVTPDTYGALLDAWVRAGFVVVAPFFPDEKPSTITAEHGADTEADLANEPADLTFVSREMMRAAATQTSGCPVLHGLVDPERISLAGHSDGGDAIATLFYNGGEDPQGVPYARLHRGIDYRALIVLAGAESAPGSYGVISSRPSLLMMQSRADQCNPVRSAQTLYRAIGQRNKWYLDLLTAHHLPAFDGADALAFAQVRSTSIAFLQMASHLSITGPNLAAVGNRRPDVARLLTGGSGPSTGGVAPLPSRCGVT